jgi:hypothetical protein
VRVSITVQTASKDILVDIIQDPDYIPIIPSIEGIFMRCHDGGMGAAPAGEAHDLALGRLRDPARPAL